MSAEVTKLRVMPTQMLRLVVMLALGVTPVTAAPPLLLGSNGHGLRGLCGDINQTGYFAGAIDQSVWLQNAPYCLPQNLRAWQARDAICNFVEEEPPETLEYPAPWHIRKALQSAFPCDPALDVPIDVGLSD